MIENLFGTVTDGNFRLRQQTSEFTEVTQLFMFVGSGRPGPMSRSEEISKCHL